MRGVEAIAAFPIFGGVAGRRGEGEQGAGGRIELREALVVGAEIGAEGVVAAGIENHHIHRVACPVEAFQQQAHIHRLRGDVRLLLDTGIHRYQKVVPVELQRVAGVIEQADALALFQLLREIADRILHLLPVRVQLHGDAKAGGGELFGHGLRIVGRVRQRRLEVFAVAQHQGDAWCGLRAGFGFRNAGNGLGGECLGQRRAA